MMKKNFIFAIFAAGSLGVMPLQADPMAIWTSNEDGTKGSWNTNDTSQVVSDDGNWTIKIDLDTDRLESVFGTEPDKYLNIGPYKGYDTLGKGLFSVSGSGYNNGGQDYNSHTSTFIMGWGNDWFKDISNGVAQGFQMGITSVTPKEAYKMGTPILSFEVYRFDTKKQNTADGWTINESGEGAATPTTLDEFIKGTSISSADLTIVHRTDGAIEDTKSYTTIYLTVVLEGKEGNTTLRYMAQIDDQSTYDWAGDGSLISGSGGYDVDNFTLAGLTNINAGLIDSLEIYGNAHHVNSDGSVGGVIPEPTSATLSMVALSALCARRRRRK